MSINEAEPVLLYLLLGDFLSFVGAVHSASTPPPSLRVLPPFVSFLPSCPSSLCVCVLPPFMSIDEAEPVLLYLLGNFLSSVGAVHSASPFLSLPLSFDSLRHEV